MNWEVPKSNTGTKRVAAASNDFKQNFGMLIPETTYGNSSLTFTSNQAMPTQYLSAAALLK